MALFNTTETLQGNPHMIPAISEAISGYFAQKGYAVKTEDGYAGGKMISITKGGLFRSILGMKTALNVVLTPMGKTIHFKAGVGLFGTQALPSFITLLVCWPVLVTQVWGLITQARMDDDALRIARQVINGEADALDLGLTKCKHCGKTLAHDAKFCPYCGNQAAA